MKRRLLALTLALAVCLGLCVAALGDWTPQVQVGDTSITDPNGVVYQLSNPITAIKQHGEARDDGWSTVYVVPVGTVITLLPPEGFAVEPSTYGELVFADKSGNHIGFFGTTDPMGWGTLAEDETEFVLGEGYKGQYIFECVKRGNDEESRGYIWFRTDVFDTAAQDSVDLPAGPEVPPADQDTEPVTATPTAATVVVNGRITLFDAYNIGGANFFKLRDLAHVLSGSAKQFEVSWDGAAKCISLTSGQPYTPVGGEMTAQGAGEQTAAPTASKILLDGAEVSLTAYNINGANYFKLRDIGQLFDFGVDWDNDSKTISIDTTKGYTPD